MTRLNTLDLTEPVTIEPMRAFPHIKDLVTDVSWNYRVKQKIKQGETREITEPDKRDESPTRTAQVIDLAELLKKSLNGGRAKSTTGQDSDRKSASTRAKPALRVVQTKSGATKTAAKRKRA